MKCQNAFAGVFVPFCLLFLFVIFLLDPAETAKWTFDSFLFFLERVFPSLFLFACLSSVLVSSSCFRKIYELPFGTECVLLLLGVFCGFPIGAKCAYELYVNGTISKKRAEYLLTFTNLASVPFLTGVIGAKLHGTAFYGWRLVLLQAASALLCALVFYLIMKPNCDGIRILTSPKPVPLPQAIGSAMTTMLQVGGMLTFFGTVSKAVVVKLHLPALLSIFLRCLLEFSSGCADAAGLLSPQSELLTGFAVGFSGLCVAFQVSAVTKNKLSMKPYFLSKLLQGIILAILFPLIG